jgi:hypothetical protein
MASNLKQANQAVNTMADALAAQANNGYIRIYGDTQPASADTAISGQTLLAELRFPASAFGAANAGVIVAGTIAPVNAVDTDTATWYRCLKSDGTTPLWDGSVGTSDADMILNSVSIGSGALVTISSFTRTVTK